MEQVKSKVPFLAALSAGLMLTVGTLMSAPVTFGLETDVPKNHGQAVSAAVHAAQDAGTPVNEAATEAAHDRSTLPEGAQNAPGQQEDSGDEVTASDVEEEVDNSDSEEGKQKGKSDAAKDKGNKPESKGNSKGGKP